MGINGLLTAVQDHAKKGHISVYRGKRVGIDTYCWLHKAVFGQASAEICLTIPTERYVKYIVNRVALLKRNGVIPVFVFDGAPLLSKAETEASRGQRRKESLKKALNCLESHDNKEAFNHFQKAVDVSPELTFAVFRMLKAQKIEYIVAPYEADAQLAYLMMTKYIDAVITEDSDLLAFGCTDVFYKMNNDGNGTRIRLNMNNKDNDDNNNNPNKLIRTDSNFQFHNFNHNMFLEMCILAGCDYLSSIYGISLKRSYLLILKHQEGTEAIRTLRFEGKSIIPVGYEDSFIRAKHTFLHQRVFDPVNRCIVYLTSPQIEIPPHHEAYLGDNIDDDIAQDIADGILHPCSPYKLLKPPIKNDDMEKYIRLYGKNRYSSSGNSNSNKYSSNKYFNDGNKKNTPKRTQSNTITSYFNSPQPMKQSSKLPTIPKKKKTSSAIILIKKDTKRLKIRTTTTTTITNNDTDDFFNAFKHNPLA